MKKTLDESSKPSMPFAFRIAFFNAFMFFVVVWTDCRTFALWPEGQIEPAPVFGCWAYLWAAGLFAVNLFFLTRKSRICRVVGPFLITAGGGVFVSVAYFGWPQQHIDQVVAFGLYPIAGLIATQARLVAPLGVDLIHDPCVPFEARLERIRQGAGFWMTLTISGGVAFLAFVHFWMNNMSNLVAVGFADRGHQVVARGLYAIQIGVYAVYFVLGPIYEGFAKVRSTNRLLLELRDGNAGRK